MWVAYWVSAGLTDQSQALFLRGRAFILRGRVRKCISRKQYIGAGRVTVYVQTSTNRVNQQQ